MGRVFQVVMQWLPWFSFLPLLAASLLALPLVMELENGTYRLAWTQGVTRGRWVRTKLGILSLCGLAFAALFALTFHWWSSPWDQDNGRLSQEYYDLRGTIPIGHTLFAIGLMLAVGTVLRRPVPAIVLAVAAYGAVIIPFALWVRPYVIPSLTEPVGDSFQAGDWIVAQYWRDSAGKRLSHSEYADLCSQAQQSKGEAWNCIVDNGLVLTNRFHPASHYWPLQFVETGIFLAAGAALIGFAAWYMLRRIE